MAAYNKFNCFVKDLIEKKHNFASDTFKIALTNTPPSAANTVLADITQIAAGNGYVTGGNAMTITDSLSGGIAKVSGANVVFTAAGGSIGPFRYAVFYNSTAVGGPLIAWFDYGSSVTLNNTETVTVAPDPTNGVFQIS